MHQLLTGDIANIVWIFTKKQTKRSEKLRSNVEKEAPYSTEVRIQKTRRGIGITFGEKVRETSE